MDYISEFKELHIEANENYPRNDIGMAKLFFDLHSKEFCYVEEAKSWYRYTGRFWKKDEGGLRITERCKGFAQALMQYAMIFNSGDEEGKVFIKYTSGFHSRYRRDGLLSDARSIAPKSLAIFDRDKLLFNCFNGTYNLGTMTLHLHSPNDYITKISRVKYVEGAICERWEQFINEIMCGDADTTRFLQKALGYALSGDTSHECFFILHGNKTRNGKSTLMETVGFMLGDYARNVQPQTLSRRPNDGASAAPDTARLNGARLVKTSELEKKLELNTALIKQLTGGDTYTARFLHENPVEFIPQFKIYMNTNHLPHAEDDTVFTSGRVRLIPFDRHFKADEQDKGLKELFRRGKNKSGILNWLLQGYKLLQAEGLDDSPLMMASLAAYRKRASKIAFNTEDFINEMLLPAEGKRVKTSMLYDIYAALAQDRGWDIVSRPAFIAKLEERVAIKRHSTLGHTVLNHFLKSEWQTFWNGLQEVSPVS